MNLYSFDGTTHDGLTIGQTVDIDVPSDGAAVNFGYTNASKRMVYQQGEEWDMAGCQYNDTRYCGMSFLGYIDPDGNFNQNSAPYGAYIGDNEIYVWPQVGFVDEELYANMQVPGYSTLPYDTDLHSVITYFNNYEIGYGDTITIFTILSSVMDGSSSDLAKNIDKARAWFEGHIAGDLIQWLCGDVNGSQNIDIDDIVYLIFYVFQGGPPPVPNELAGDVDCSGGIDIDDIVYLITYIFQGGPEPCANCKR